jgi:hypothetical protein
LKRTRSLNNAQVAGSCFNINDYHSGYVMKLATGVGGSVIYNKVTAILSTGEYTPECKIATAVATLVVVGLPFIGFTNLVLFHFYIRGAFLADTGLLASLLWHSDAALTMPMALGGGESFFATHVTPLFLFASALSRALPCSLAQFFAGFVGLSHALLALAVFSLLTRCYRMSSGARLWIAVLGALSFAFSGLAIAIARYPHFETLIAAFFLLFAVARQLNHPALAATMFVLGLLTREDAGFHYAAMLGLLTMLNLAKGSTLQQQRSNLIFIVIGLVYSIVAMVGQRLVFPDSSAFVRVYLGDPPLGHLSFLLLVTRALALFVSRPYIVWPALGVCFWAVKERSPWLIVGYVACLPWLLLHLMAVSPLAGLLVSYYAFPFLVALAWPLLGVLWQRQWQGHSAAPTGPLAGFAALMALSFIPGIGVHDPGRLPLPNAFLWGPSVAEQMATDRGVAAVVAARPALGRLLVDNSVAALSPNSFAPSEVPFRSGSPQPEPAVIPDTVAFFTDGYDAERLRASASSAGLSYQYVVTGTPLHLIAREPLEAVPALADCVMPAAG